MQGAAASTHHAGCMATQDRRQKAIIQHADTQVRHIYIHGAILQPQDMLGVRAGGCRAFWHGSTLAATLKENIEGGMRGGGESGLHMLGWAS